MNRKHFLLAVVLFAVSYVMGQNPLTIVPPKYIKNQTISLPLPTGPGGNSNSPNNPFDYYDAGFLMDGSANCMADMQGNLRFFIVDGLIFDGQQGAYVDYAWCYMDTYNETTTTYHVKQYQSSNYVGQETVIVPHPVNCNQYYIFSSIVTQNYLMKQNGPNNPPTPTPEPPTPTPDPTWFTMISSQPVYCLYDAATQQVLKRGVWYDDPAIALQNPIDGLSEAIFTTALTSNPNISNGDTPVTHLNWGEQTSVCGNLSLAASDLRPDGTRFITCYLRNHLYIIQITATGNLRYWKRYETPANLYYLYVKESEMELIYDNTTQNYIIAATNGHFGQNLLLYKLTSDMLSLVNLQEYAMPNSSSTGVYEISGLEFSPDKTKLYVTSEIFNNVVNASSLNYFNLNQATLQHLPVNSSNNNLASLSSLENGLDGNMYIATATGVYRMTNPNNPSAAVISSSPVYSFPIHLSEVGVVPNLTVFGHRGYRLPDNVDGMNYNTHFFSDLSCCVSNNSFDKSSYTTNATTLPSWTGNNNNLEAIPNSNIATIRDELRIKKGTSLTITGMEIRFAPGAKLIIEAGDNQVSGGKLILNATTLTVDTRCSSDALWDGVEVQGIYNQPQGSIYGASKQGRLILTNNSIIEHARKGVIAGSFDNSNGTYIAEKTGGIIVASNSIFRNNQRDVVFRKYISPNGQNNFSSFVNCQFLVSQTLKGNVQPINHVELHNIKNVYFGGCDFKHTSAYLRQGNGIYALNSIFNVKAHCNSQTIPCSNYDPNLFENLSHGIWVNAAGATSTFSSDRNVFINNLVGIRATNTNLAAITRNQFKLYEATTQTTGLYLVNSTKYVVEENDFDIVANTPMPSAQTYGIVVNNSGALPNSIYKNTFHNLYIGGQSESVNSNNDVTVAGSTGLVWKCNTFNKPIEKHDLIVINGRISYNQGLVNSGSALLANQYAASNVFSLANEAITLEHDFFLSNANPINYVYVSNAANIRPDSYTNTLMSIQPTLVNSSQVLYNSTNACPTRLDKGKEILAINLVGLKADFTANGPSIQLQAEIDRTIDDLLREVLLDTTQSRDFADLIPLLSTETNKVYKDLLINTYTLQNEFTSATNLLYSISNCERTQELNAVLIDLFNLQDDNHFLSQYPNHYETLQSLSNDETFKKTANRAKVILATLNQLDLDENYEFYEANVVRNSALTANNTDAPYLVYPNPFENEITLIGNELTNRKIVIVDLSGTIVFQTTIDELSETVSLAGLSHGLYLLSIYDNENHVIQTNRIVKK